MLAIYLWAAMFVCTVSILFWALKQVLPVRLASRDTLANDAYFLFDSARLVKASRAGRQLLAATEDGAEDWAGFYASFGPWFDSLPQLFQILACKKTQFYTLLMAPFSAYKQLVGICV